MVVSLNGLLVWPDCTIHSVLPFKITGQVLANIGLDLNKEHTSSSCLCEWARLHLKCFCRFYQLCPHYSGECIDDAICLGQPCCNLAHKLKINKHWHGGTHIFRGAKYEWRPLSVLIGIAIVIVEGTIRLDVYSLLLNLKGFLFREKYKYTLLNV